MPLVKLINTVVVGRPGDEVIAFGHKFTIQPDMSATADIHPDFIKDEVAAGRYKVIEKQPKEIKVKNIGELNDFTFELDQYFGAGSLGKLMKQIAPLRKELLEEFAASRLQITLQPSMTNKEMRSNIKAIIKSRLPKNDDEGNTATDFGEDNE